MNKARESKLFSDHCNDDPDLGVLGLMGKHTKTGKQNQI